MKSTIVKVVVIAALAGIPLALLGATLYIGMGSGDGDSSDESTDGGLSPSASGEVATVAQYASTVARSGDLQDDLAKLDGCNWLGSGGLDLDPGLITCRAGAFTVQLSAATLALRLENAQKPDSPAYIGAPPAEVDGLVNETIEHARALEASSKKLSDDGCIDSGAGACGDQRGQVWRDMNQMRETFDAWAPYL